MKFTLKGIKCLKTDYTASQGHSIAMINQFRVISAFSQNKVFGSYAPTNERKRMMYEWANTAAWREPQE